MPTIRSSADLRNGYNDISTFCHTSNETVFITKNGKGDLAVMSIEEYDRLMSKIALYERLEKGMEEIAKDKTRPFSDAMSEIRSKRKR